jgi:hypothetical protein
MLRVVVADFGKCLSAFDEPDRHKLVHKTCCTYFMKTMKLFVCALVLASAMPMASAACPSEGVVTPFTGACTLANIEQQLGCTLSTIGFQAAAVKKACDASA